VGLEWDVKALRLLEQRRQGQAIVVSVVCDYAMPNERINIEWSGAESAERDPDLVQLDARAGVLVYTHCRIAAYLRWQPLRVTVSTLPWWRCFVVEHDAEVLRALRRWEGAHPSLRVRPTVDPLVAWPDDRTEHRLMADGVFNGEVGIRVGLDRRVVRGLMAVDEAA